MNTTNKRGFTLIELLVATAILIIVFGLVTYLYTRAAKVRKTIVIHSEIQQVLSQMLTTITYGEDKKWGLIDATSLESGESTTFVVINEAIDRMDVTINPENGKIFVNGMDLDPGNKIMLLPKEVYPENPSRFEYFNSKGEQVEEGDIPDQFGTITFIKITLSAKPTDPSMKDLHPAVLTTGVKLRNKISSPSLP
ncbi:type II secretion system GspH family protein [bacterium]|nr:type II secretion system GspH family protein [bacterium]